MYDILHRIVIETSPEQLYKAIAEDSGISGWWTKAEMNDQRLRVFFGPKDEHQIVFTVTDTQPAEFVKWQCIEGPWADKGEFVFSITPDERGACLRFSHHAWTQADDFYRHCNSKWGYFLTVSLKRYLETGTGQPHPQDPDI